MRLTLSLCLLFIAISVAYPQTGDAGITINGFVESHNISVKILPMDKSIEGSDLIKFKLPLDGSIKLRMLADFEIKSVESAAKKVPFSIEKDSIYQTITVTPDNKVTNEIRVTYKGIVYHKPNERLLNQKHAYTPGMVSDAAGEGIYLPGGSYYPQASEDLADFFLEATVPDSITIITSGKSEVTLLDNGMRKFTYHTEQPADELIVVGGKFAVVDTIYKDKKFQVCTFEANTNAKNYLKAIIDYYDMYTELFGPYPYSGFVVVENFFASGFGMPGYTLLSNKLMAMPWIVLSPGSLAHEFVHNWWGNSLFVDYESGNWCEALTSFSTNYYFNVITKQMEGALDWRKKALLSLASLPEKSNYPVIKFRYQENSDDAVIGYQKGGFIFYELIKLMGDGHFFAAIKDFASTFKGKRALWSDMENIFEKYALENKLNIPIPRVFDQWLNSTRLPSIKLGSVNVDGDQLSFTIKQDTSFFMMVPVKIITDKETQLLYCTIAQKENLINHKINGNLKTIIIDPEYQTLRELYQWEIPYSLNQTLLDGPIVILPTKNSGDYAICEKFSQMLSQSGYDISAKSADEINDNDLKDKSVFLIGNFQSNSYMKKLTEKLPIGIFIADTTLSANGKEYSLNGNVLLMTMANPMNGNRNLSLMSFSGITNPEQFRRVFYYFGSAVSLINQSKASRPILQLEMFPSGIDKSAMIYMNKEK